MKPASGALIALLNSSTQFVMADLLTLTLAGGDAFLFSAASTAIADQATGRVFALGPKIERTKTKLTVGTQVDELDVTVYPEPADLLGATTWLQAAWTGQLDGAEIVLERAFMGAAFGAGGWGDTAAGTVVLFSGRISDLEASRTMLLLKCRSHLELLNINMPRRLWQSPCTFNFGDAMCGYDRVAGRNAAGTPTGFGAIVFAAAAGSTQTLIQGAPGSTGPYAQGTIVGQGGANAGQTRTISVFSPGVSVGVTLAFLSPIAAGDTFQMLPGCDRTLGTCGNVFLNSRLTVNEYNPSQPERFGGMPFIPIPEDAL
jgi:Uncharacterized conserved protein (DUF2163)/Phage conserved hypothetical protein BR0599